VVIEICIKYPGGPTRIRGTDLCRYVVAYEHEVVVKRAGVFLLLMLAINARARAAAHEPP
jgi:hypothetical protein